jgi:beta-galactosidase GanA
MSNDYYTDKPAVTRNSFGKGQAIYLGAFGDESFYETLFGWLLQERESHPRCMSLPGCRSVSAGRMGRLSGSS